MLKIDIYYRKKLVKMKTSDFFYDLPPELIAQTPIENRDNSRLLVLDKATGKIDHRHFYDVLSYLNEGDCLVLNDTRVLPARLYGVKEETGAVVEFLLLKQKGALTWEALAGPGKKAKAGNLFRFSDRFWITATEFWSFAPTVNFLPCSTKSGKCLCRLI